MPVFLSLLNLAQATFSAFDLYLASIAIRNLLGYEEKAKKAAKWSDTAAKELWDTRTTQASNALALLLTFLSSVSMLFFSMQTSTKSILAAVNIAALALARDHVGSMWMSKAKIPLPGVGDYNEAISVTQRTRLGMLYLGGAWFLVGLLGLVM